MSSADRSARTAAVLAVCTALLLAAQVALAGLPNMELVSLLVLLYTRLFGKKTLWVIYAFALLEGLLYGFHLWWLMYLYVWPLWYLAVTLLARKNRTTAQWATACGVFGLCFGALCAVSYVPLAGVAGAFGWWIAGIPMDLLHGAGNFLLTWILLPPLWRVMARIAPKI